jgi:methylphosphotriester-DNA--protein-cysteine methyltransferase
MLALPKTYAEANRARRMSQKLERVDSVTGAIYDAQFERALLRQLV